MHAFPAFVPNHPVLSQVRNYFLQYQVDPENSMMTSAGVVFYSISSDYGEAERAPLLMEPAHAISHMLIPLQSSHSSLSNEFQERLCRCQPISQPYQGKWMIFYDRHCGESHSPVSACIQQILLFFTPFS